MRARILGAAAGGGFPQWNCACPICTAARNGQAQPRTQSSVAIRGERGPWFLINASPDLRQQLADLPVHAQESNGMRRTPVGGVILTDAEIDHTAGLLLMRESSIPLEIYCTAEVHGALTDHYPVMRMLEHYCGVNWHPLKPGVLTPLEGSPLTIEPFETGGDAPLYMGAANPGSANPGSADPGPADPGDAPGPTAIGLTIRELDGAVLCYAPALASLQDGILDRLAASDCLFADGTFWQSDDLVALGLGDRDSWAMGHAPLSGAQGTLATLARLTARTILVHINNTNPILLDRSEQRAATEADGIEVGYDGMEIEL